MGGPCFSVEAVVQAYFFKKTIRISLPNTFKDIMRYE